MENDEFSMEILENSDDDEDLYMHCAFCSFSAGSRTQLLDHINHYHGEEIGNDDMEIGEDMATERILAYLRKSHSLSAHRIPEVEIRNHLLRAINRNPFDFFDLLNEQVGSSNNRFGFSSKTFEISLNSMGLDAIAYGCSLTLMHSIFSYVLKTISINLSKDSSSELYINLSVESPNILAFPITTPYIKYSEFSVNQFLSDISLVQTSRPSLFIDDRLRITVSCLAPGIERTKIGKLFGGGGDLKKAGSATTALMRKKGFGVFAPNVCWEHDCGLVALHLALLIHKNPKSWRKNTQITNPLASQELKIAVLKLASSFPEIDWSQKQGISTCSRMQEHLNAKEHLQLMVFDGLNPKKIYFKGFPVRPHGERLNLIYHDEHLSVIESVQEFFKVTECQGCLKIFGAGKHKVCYGRKSSCPDCKTEACIKETRFEREETRPIFCEECNCLFRSQACFHYHKNEETEVSTNEKTTETSIQLPVCKYMIQCIQCGKKQRRSSAWCKETPSHDCLMHKCEKCGEETAMVGGKPHFCFIQPASQAQLGLSTAYMRWRGLPGKLCPGPKPLYDPSQFVHPTKDNLSLTYPSIVGKKAFVFFDLETRTVGKKRKLVPFAMVAAFMCSECCFSNYLSPELWEKSYSCCGDRIRRYVGLNEIKQFIVTVFFRMKSFTSVIMFAFFGAGFDNIFILDLLVSLK